MSLQVTGELFVRAFGGRRGHFNIGKLVTPYGEFSVKDALIDELDAGAYRGVFDIDRLFLVNSQMPSGAIIVEMRARLAQMLLDADRPVADVSEPVGLEERDPIDEPDVPLQQAFDTPPPPTAGAADAVPTPALDHCPSPQAEAVPPPEATDAGDDEVGLFAELWPLGDEVQLDPAVGRPLMRRQIEALKRRGYRYNAQRKVWRIVP